jgi:hypothetical protein
VCLGAESAGHADEEGEQASGRACLLAEEPDGAFPTRLAGCGLAAERSERTAAGYDSRKKIHISSVRGFGQTVNSTDGGAGPTLWEKLAEMVDAGCHCR